MVTKFEEGQRYRVNASDLKQNGREFTFQSGKSPYHSTNINYSGAYHFWDDFVLPEWCIAIENLNKKEVTSRNSSQP